MQSSFLASLAFSHYLAFHRHDVPWRRKWLRVPTVPQRFGSELGLMTGIIGAAGGLGGYALPLILGKLYQSTGTYTSGFLILSFVTLGSLTLLTVMQSKWKNKWMAKGGKAALDTRSDVSYVNV